jgi:branched-chain amino acid transport system permease protein
VTSGRGRTAGAAVLAAVAIAAWLSVDYFGYELITEIAILAILAMSLDLLVGFAGMVSLGHAAFYGIGAYGIAAFTTMLGWSPGAAMAVAVAASAAAAMVVGAVAVRLGGIFFIMVTLAIGEAVHAYLFKARAFGGDDGLAGIAHLDLSMIGVDLADPSAFAAFALVVAALAYAVLEMVVRSPFGRLLVAIHQNERRARALGCRVERVKLGAFTLAGALAGLAGTLTAQHTGFISPELLAWTVSGEALIVVIVGGMSSLVGPAVGAAVIVLAKHWVSDWTNYWMLGMGGAFIAVVVLMPNGIYAALGTVRRRLHRAAR